MWRMPAMAATEPSGKMETEYVYVSEHSTYQSMTAGGSSSSGSSTEMMGTRLAELTDDGCDMPTGRSCLDEYNERLSLCLTAESAPTRACIVELWRRRGREGRPHANDGPLPGQEIGRRGLEG